MFISQFADRIIADYRGVDTPAAEPRIMPGGIEPRRDPVGDDPGEPPTPFDPASLHDERRLALANKALRPGQAVFRAKLMQVYEGRCAITGCNVPAALEAAHIVPFSGPASDHVSNGLLLRLDLHALFDAHLICIKPPEMTVCLTDSLIGGFYEVVNGRKLRLPKDVGSRPNLAALSQHYREFESAQLEDDVPF